MTAEPTVLVIDRSPAADGEGLRAALGSVGGICVRTGVDPSQSPAPHLIVLDLDDFQESGFEILSHLRLEARTRRVPVIVFTSSGEAAEVERAYSLGASTCLRKTSDRQLMNEVARAVRDFAGILAS